MIVCVWKKSLSCLFLLLCFVTTSVFTHVTNKPEPVCSDANSDTKCNTIAECTDASQCTTEFKELLSSNVCELPPYPSHGTYVVNGDPKAKPKDLLPAAALNVTCDAGYEVSGTAEPVCFSGIWSGTAECTPSTKCVLPPVPAHGSYVVTGVPNAVPGQAFDSVALNVTCDPGYDIEGDKGIVCFSGIWSGTVTDCTAGTKCVLPPFPAHGSYVVTGVPNAVPGQSFDSVALNVTCDPGYDIEGDKGIVCFSGIWSGTVTDCTASTKCVLPPVPAHGSYVVTGVPNAVPGQAFDSVALNITCDPGYDIEGDKGIVCFSGIWSGTVTDCTVSAISCVLPPYPAHGRYIVAGNPDAIPGQALDSVSLNITCDPGFDIDGDKSRICFSGIWSDNITDCEALCRLDKNPTVEYRCLHPSAATSEWQWSRECDLYEHNGIIVKPQCKKDHFFPGTLNRMRCTNGKWNYVARCIPATNGACILPPFPVNGSYVVSGIPKPVPGQTLITVALTITCNLGTDISGRKDRTCYNGVWSGGIKDCVSTKSLCILPPYPSYGNYTVVGEPNAAPQQAFDTVTIKVRCNSGYENPEKSDVTCRKGKWSGRVRDCVPERPIVAGPYIPFGELESDSKADFCRLEKDPSVNYRCLLSAASRATRECNLTEPIGTIVKPECKVPNYHFPGVLNHMRCFNGRWNYIARCVPECGLVTPKGSQLVIGGRPAVRGELPWHAAIYVKQEDHRKQICGGSIITQKVVISAGHCFLEGGFIQPASKYSVAVGKLYRPWDDARDEEVQKSDLADLIMPKRFQGGVTNFQEDIALLILKQTITYQKHIRPICLDFNEELEKRQLQDGHLGTVAGWGLNAENGKPSNFLKVVELPFVPIEACQADSPLHFREYITGDKICAGYRNGTAVCKGDSGGGLVFPRQEEDKKRYYLRGLVSTAPNNNTLCNALWLTMFTQVSRHERFIKDNAALA